MEERGERTEQPTQRARERARQRGDIPHSTELSSAGILLIGFIGMLFTMSIWISSGQELMSFCLGNFHVNDMTGRDIATLFAWALAISVRMVWPVFAGVVIGGLLINFAQTKGNISTEKLKPSLNKLNPITNAKNLFSMKRLVEALKSIIKISLAVVIGYSVIHGNLDRITVAGLKGPAQYIHTFGALAFELGVKIILAFMILAIFDYMYQRWEHEKKLKMSHQEVKEDYKQTEGDPLIKQRLRQRQRQIAMTRMLREVPRADVVVTNPTEVAVALRFDELTMPAPTIVAKGKGRIAERIRALAEQFDVPVYPAPPLARALYAACDVGDLIPFELYKSIAEVLAWVYSLKKKRPRRRA